MTDKRKKPEVMFDLIPDPGVDIMIVRYTAGKLGYEPGMMVSGFFSPS